MAVSLHHGALLVEQEVGLVGEHYDGYGDPSQREHEAKDTNVELTMKY